MKPFFPTLMLCLGAVLTAAGDDFANTELTAKIHPLAPPKEIPFPLQDVRLLDGMFKDGQDVAVKYLLSLEPDRFLANFRKEAGLPPKARQYGGWELQGVLAQQVFGSNLVRDCKKARGSCVNPWSLLVESSPSGGMVPLYDAARTFFQGQVHLRTPGDAGN